MWLRLLEVLCHEPPQGLNLSEEVLEDYLGNNLARMVGIEPTPHPKTLEEARTRLALAAQAMPSSPRQLSPLTTTT
jgi:hypothetical protein